VIAAPRSRMLFAVLGAAVALVAAVVAYSRTGSPGEAGKALAAGVIAVAVAGLALSLPGVTARGAAIGGFFVVAGIFTWTYTNRPIVVWLVLAAEGAVFAVWGWPWLARLNALPRLGAAWLGIAYWPLGIVGAVLVGHLGVAVQRLAYAGVFTLAALAVVASVSAESSVDAAPLPGRSRRRGGDLSVGIVAAIIMAVAALLLVGSGTLFDAVHAVPDNSSAQLMRDRFWGGPGLFYHPNSLAGLAIVVAIRIGPDRAFAAWQRLAATGLAGFILLLTGSRIAFVFAAFAALLHAVLLYAMPAWRQRSAATPVASVADSPVADSPVADSPATDSPVPGSSVPGSSGNQPGDLPSYRRPWLAAGTPFAVLALVLVLSGGQGFLFQSRFGGDDVTSGRVATWKQVATDWRHAGWAEKLFGDAQTSRAVVTRADDGAPPGAPRRKLNTDNAAVGALRRGGVLGVLAFLLGLVLLLRRAAPRRPRAAAPTDAGSAALAAGGSAAPPMVWFTIAAIGAVPTIATEDWLLGGTNGVLWILLLAGEAISPVAEIHKPRSISRHIAGVS
jgi:hypothetical protein